MTSSSSVGVSGPKWVRPVRSRCRILGSIAKIWRAWPRCCRRCEGEDGGGCQARHPPPSPRTTPEVHMGRPTPALLERRRRRARLGHMCPSCRSAWALSADIRPDGFLVVCRYCLYRRDVTTVHAPQPVPNDTSDPTPISRTGQPSRSSLAPEAPGRSVRAM